MRFVKNRHRFLLALFLVVAAGSWSATASAAAGGLTVTPATLTLSLGKDTPEARSTVAVTNNYDAPITLQFAFAAEQNALQRDHQAAKALRAAVPSATLAPGQSLTQTIILAASDQLAPGSQQVSLVITQTATSNATIGVLPELRLPLIVIKEDGAITSLGLATIEQPAVGFSIPKNINTTLINTGNMVVIPRGTVTVTTPNGTVVGKGTLNTASTALSPGASAPFTTAITPLARAILPGPYTIDVTYGLGGDSTAKAAGASFLFVAWWHIGIIILLIAAAYGIARFVIPAHAYRHFTRRPPPKRPAFIGRNAS